MEHHSNPKQAHALMETVMKDHRWIHRCIQHISVLLGMPDTVLEENARRLQKITRCLRMMSRKLYDHFRKEEDGPFLKEFEGFHPQAGARLRHLFREHEELRRSIRSILEKAEVLSIATADPLKNLRQDFFEFVSLLYEHEHLESFLLHSVQEQHSRKEGKDT